MYPMNTELVKTDTTDILLSADGWQQWEPLVWSHCLFSYAISLYSGWQHLKHYIHPCLKGQIWNRGLAIRSW